MTGTCFEVKARYGPPAMSLEIKDQRLVPSIRRLPSVRLLLIGTAFGHPVASEAIVG
jgi:hypothetical protein